MELPIKRSSLGVTALSFVSKTSASPYPVKGKGCDIITPSVVSMRYRCLSSTGIAKISPRIFRERYISLFYWRLRVMTGMPHRPSSTDGHPSVFPPHHYRSSSLNPRGLPQKDARRSRSPLSGYAIARTVRQLI